MSLWSSTPSRRIGVLQTSIALDERGDGQTVLPDGLILGHEASVYVHALVDGHDEVVPVQHTFRNVHISIANSTTPITSLADVASTHARIVAQQEATYAIALGAPAEPGATEHRVMSVIQGLYMTTSLNLPGIEIRPVKSAPSGTEVRDMVNALLEDMGWASRVQQEPWARLWQARSPLTQVVCHQVWASTYDQAGEIVRDVRDRIIALMAINRRATGRPEAYS